MAHEEIITSWKQPFHSTVVIPNPAGELLMELQAEDAAGEPGDPANTVAWLTFACCTTNFC